MKLFAIEKGSSRLHTKFASYWSSLLFQLTQIPKSGNFCFGSQTQMKQLKKRGFIRAPRLYANAARNGVVQISCV